MIDQSANNSDHEMRQLQEQLDADTRKAQADTGLPAMAQDVKDAVGMLWRDVDGDPPPGHPFPVVEKFLGFHPIAFADVVNNSQNSEFMGPEALIDVGGRLGEEGLVKVADAVNAGSQGVMSKMIRAGSEDVADAGAPGATPPGKTSSRGKSQIV